MECARERRVKANLKVGYEGFDCEKNYIFLVFNVHKSVGADCNARRFNAP
jgi:hypothetical protein